MADENFAPTMRCYTCGNVINTLIQIYNKFIDDGHSETDALDALSHRRKLRECCRSMIQSELDPYSMMKPESPVATTVTKTKKHGKDKGKGKKKGSSDSSEGSSTESAVEENSSDESFVNEIVGSSDEHDESSEEGYGGGNDSEQSSSSSDDEFE